MLPRVNLGLATVSATLAALSFSGCASSPNTSSYPAGADVSQEAALLDQQMTSARGNQADVLSPENYQNADRHLSTAKSEWSKSKSVEALQDLGMAKASLDRASDVANTAQREIPEVVQARKDALAANAPVRFSNEMKKADEHLKDKTRELEKNKMKLSVDDRTQLAQEYLKIEAFAIKSKYLSQAQIKIDAARRAGAEKSDPLTFYEAQSNFKTAEIAIDTDRHNDAIIAPVAAKANESADKLAEVNRYTNQGSTEAVAIELYRKNHLVEKQKDMIQNETASNNALKDSNAQLDSQNKKLNSENATLANGASFNQVLKDAQGMFTSDEAEVYRIGDQLLIRLKDIRFPTGKAQLPSTANGTLQKVEKVMTMVGTDKVIVEGHTDDVGGQASNKRLSEKRAKTVANVLVKDSAVQENSVETKGYGFDKPLTSNKTKEGRAQNRRVDILITPRSQTM